MPLLCPCFSLIFFWGVTVTVQASWTIRPHTARDLSRQRNCQSARLLVAQAVAAMVMDGVPSKFGLAKLLFLKSLDQFNRMDWFRDQFKLKPLPLTVQQYF